MTMEKSSASPSLLGLSVSEFLARVASAETPVPAGGSVSALVGALSASLLMLVSDVLSRRRKPPALGDIHDRAAELQSQLAALMDEDVRAYEAYLANGSSAEATRTVEDVARLAGDVADLASQVAILATGPVKSDARIAVTLARAAQAAAQTLADENRSSD
jgi:formiminotetrahydrofolate cyclodeaminase